MLHRFLHCDAIEGVEKLQAAGHVVVCMSSDEAGVYVITDDSKVKRKSGEVETR